MRKSNSNFKTAFVSESGAELINNDYFAYVEEDNYACYVLASGITDFESSEAAKEVVENLILSFEENPSMTKHSLVRYMKETNERLLNSQNSRRLKASVIMIVTNYEKFRYAAAGNVRLRMYRKGRFIMKSSDMSLAQDIIDKEKSNTPLDRHEERHNLYAYLGKKDFFNPFVSNTIKLMDADILTLYSKGLWEHVDEQEIDEIFSEASDKPQESVDYLEDVLLSRQPPNLKSYTIVAIFINKVFKDPDRERKRMMYIKIALFIIVLILIAAIIFYIFQVIKQNKEEDYQAALNNAHDFIVAENYSRALEYDRKALDLARDLRHTDDEKNLKDEVMLLECLVQADTFYQAQNYPSAYDAYLKALRYSSASDLDIRNYIQSHIDAIDKHMNVDQFMALGDRHFQNGDYDAAEEMYKKAAEQAALARDIDGRQKAVAAIEKVYDKRAEIRKDAEQKLDAKKQMAISDALKRGDDLLAAGDLEGAQQAYLDARNLSDNPADRTQTSDALAKVSDARQKKELEERTTSDERKKKFEDATQTEAKGDTSFDSGDYISAEMYYITAMEMFSELEEHQKVAMIKKKYEAADAQFQAGFASKDNAAKTEQVAREFYAVKNYTEAKAAATMAKEMYDNLGMKSKVDEMDILLQQISTDEMIADVVK